MRPHPPIMLGPVPLGAGPVIVAVVSDEDILDGVPLTYPAARVLELRVDRFRDLSPDHVGDVSRTAAATGRGVLVTVRDVREGGEKDMDDDRRLELFQSASGAHAFDLEISSSPDLWGSLAAIAVESGRLLIGSFHDFAATPSREILETLWSKGCDLGAHVLKFACRVSAPDELRRLCDFTLAHSDEGIITLGMGPWGPFSRIVTPAFGSLLAYGFVASAVAPGQLSVAELDAEFSRWYPNSGQGREG